MSESEILKEKCEAEKYPGETTGTVAKLQAITDITDDLFVNEQVDEVELHVIEQPETYEEPIEVIDIYQQVYTGDEDLSETEDSPNINGKISDESSDFEDADLESESENDSEDGFLMKRQKSDVKDDDPSWEPPAERTTRRRGQPLSKQAGQDRGEKRHLNLSDDPKRKRGRMSTKNQLGQQQPTITSTEEYLLKMKRPDNLSKASFIERMNSSKKLINVYKTTSSRNRPTSIKDYSCGRSTGQQTDTTQQSDAYLDVVDVVFKMRASLQGSTSNVNNTIHNKKQEIRIRPSDLHDRIINQVTEEYSGNDTSMEKRQLKVNGDISNKIKNDFSEEYLGRYESFENSKKKVETVVVCSEESDNSGNELSEDSVVNDAFKENTRKEVEVIVCIEEETNDALAVTDPEISKLKSEAKILLKFVQAMKEKYPNSMACDECHICFLSKNEAEGHMDEHTGSMFVCSFCDIGFNSEEIFNIHGTIHQKPREKHVIACSVCKWTDSSKILTFVGHRKFELLQKHFHQKHQDIPDDHFCPVCCARFQSSALLKYHVELHLPKQGSCSCKNVECFACTDLFSKFERRPFNRVRNFKEHNDMQASLEKKSDRQCHMCQLKVLDIQDHVNRHHNEKDQLNYPYICSVCKVSFPTKRVAELHLRIHKGQKLYNYVENEKKPCCICQESFTNLFHHVVTKHTTAKPTFRCYVCGTQYPEKNLYLQHLSYHLPSRCNCKQPECYMCNDDSGSLLFSCFVDEEDFMELGAQCTICQLIVPNLKEHMKLHDLNSPFQCSICSVSFKDKTLANFHVNIHKRHYIHSRHIRSSQCSICKKSGLKSLYLHVVSCHADVECAMECELCKMRFSEVQLYNMHVNNHFPAKCWCKHKDCYNCESQNRKKSNKPHDLQNDGLKNHESNDSESSSKIDQSKMNNDTKKEMHFVNCEKCNIQVYSEHLEKHLKEHDMSKAKFRCKVCKVTFPSSQMTQLHTGVHSCRIPKAEFYCSLCKTIPNPKHGFKTCNIIKHVELEHWMEEMKFSCCVCGERFPETNAHTAHMELHAPNKCLCNLDNCKFCNHFKCETCNQGFKKSELQRYIVHKGRCKTDICIGKTVEFALKLSKSNSFSMQNNGPFENVKTEVVDKPPALRTESKSSLSKVSSTVVRDADNSSRKSFSQINEVNDKHSVMISSGKNTKIPERESNPTKRIARVQPFVQHEDSMKMPYPMEADDTASNVASSEDYDHEEDIEEETECTACGMVIPSGSIVDHFKEYHSTKCYKCTSCKITFKLKDQLLSHSMVHLNRQRVLCSLCHVHFSHSTHWNAHVSAQHDNHLVCTICMEVFGYQTSLQHHRKAYVFSLPRKFPCNWCCVSFQNFADLKEHKKLHGKECACGGADCSKCNKFRCTCGSTFKSHEFLLFRIHVMKCLRCYKCDAVFDTEELLMMHERNHYMKCSVCGVAKRNNTQLQEHLGSHKCRCPADSTSCLLCKKAWCVKCNKRFTPEELVMFKEHKRSCREASVLCICKDRDCFICSKYKCSFCGLQFHSFQIASFNMHKRKCSSSAPQSDPFMTVKTEKKVVDLVAPRKRGTVESQIISLDSEDDDDDDGKKEIDQTSLVDSSFTEKQHLNQECSQSLKISPLEGYLLAKTPTVSLAGTEKLYFKRTSQISASGGLDIDSSIKDPVPPVAEQDPIPIPAPIITIQPVEDDYGYPFFNETMEVDVSKK